MQAFHGHCTHTTDNCSAAPRNLHSLGDERRKLHLEYLGFRRGVYVKEYEKVMKQWLEGTLRETERRHMKHWLERCSHLTMLCESVLGRMKVAALDGVERRSSQANHIEMEESQARATTEQDDALVLDILAEMEVQTSYSAVFYCSKERRRLVFG
jgi:hypothetical protein